MTKVRYSYLPQQFNNCPELWKNLKKFVKSGDFTLGKELKIFEKNFAKLIGTKYACGVNSGTDALIIAIKSLGLKNGDEILITEKFGAIKLINIKDKSKKKIVIVK